MFKLTAKQCEELAKALYGMANITFAALVIGQFLATAFKVDIFIFGLIFTVAIYIIATILNKGLE